MDNITDRLSGRIGDKEIKLFISELIGNSKKKELMYSLIRNDNKRIACNAAWLLTRLPIGEVDFLQEKQDELINIAMSEKESDTLRRLSLNILNRQSFSAKTLRGDFIDYCQETMMAIREQPGIRALCLKLAYKQCSLIPELLSELKQYISLLNQSPMSPAIRSTLKQITIGKVAYRK